MMKFRNLSAAFVFNGDELLLMKRSENRRLFADFWAPVGGHLERDELNDPRKACLREINEETGLRESDFDFLKLKYITIRRKAAEIRVQYLYIGSTTVRELSETDEGELHWVKHADVFARRLSTANESALRHFFELGKGSDEVFVGVVSVVNDVPVVNWEMLDSYESDY